MKTIGKDIYIQRGENWSLDFEVLNEKGDPYQLFEKWKHPYLAITVSAARYQQEGDFRRTYWLDLDNRWVEDVAGNMSLVPLKRFMSTEALSITNFAVNEVLANYGEAIGGRIILDKDSDFDVTKFLFFTDPLSDNNRVYKYCKSYIHGKSYRILSSPWVPDTNYDKGSVVDYIGTNYVARKDTSAMPGGNQDWLPLIHDAFNVVTKQEKLPSDPIGTCFIFDYHGEPAIAAVDVDNTICSLGEDFYEFYMEGVIVEEWEDYSFRVIKSFDTRDWVEQNYLFDMKVLCGDTIDERLYSQLSQNSSVAETYELPPVPWNEDTRRDMMTLLSTEEREYWSELYASGIPIMPDYDTKAIVLEPTNLMVSANIQGGVK